MKNQIKKIVLLSLVCVLQIPLISIAGPDKGKPVTDSMYGKQVNQIDTAADMSLDDKEAARKLIAQDWGEARCTESLTFALLVELLHNKVDLSEFLIRQARCAYRITSLIATYNFAALRQGSLPTARYADPAILTGSLMAVKTGIERAKIWYNNWTTPPAENTDSQTPTTALISYTGQREQEDAAMRPVNIPTPTNTQYLLGQGAQIAQWGGAYGISLGLQHLLKQQGLPLPTGMINQWGSALLRRGIKLPSTENAPKDIS
jgi:hypothetical protein